MDSTIFYIALLSDEVIVKKSLRDLAIYITDHNLRDLVDNAIVAGADVFTNEIYYDLENECDRIEEELTHSDRLLTSNYL